LRDGTRHPFPATVAFIADGIDSLRELEAPDAGRKDVPLDFWRGIRNIEVPRLFNGGTEFAPMSSTSDILIALEFSDNCDTRLIFKISTETFLERGADLQFLSVYPGEAEYLYPPNTFLLPTGKVETMRRGRVEYTIIEVTPHK